MKHISTFFIAVFGRSTFAAVFLISSFATPVHANVKLASFFADHMVLQRDRKICIWGLGDPNAKVEVRIASQRVTTVVETNGSWKAYLEPMTAGGPYILTASLGNTTNTVKDVLYGDIWLCSGQSNMQLPVKESAASEQTSTPVHHPHLASRSTNNAVRGFAVAGDDGIYRFANARIDGESVIVQCDHVPAPKTVRYAWAGVPDSTLINEAGLPAAPFRTDDFPYSNVEVQKEPVSHQATTSAYEIRVDGNGQVTSLAVRGAQFLSNEPGMAGGTSIPAMFGPRSLPDIQNLGSELLSCSDGNITFLLQVKETGMDWTISNRGKDEIKFNIALSSHVIVDRQGNSEIVTLTHKKSTFTIDGIDSVSDSENGKVLQVVVKGESSRQLVLNMSGI